MGIIEKQSIKGTVYSYLGVGVGFVTAGILQPWFFTEDQNGVLDLLMTWSLLFATLATLGINNVTNRLFPWFRDPASRHHRYFGIVFRVTAIGFILSMVLYFILRPGIIASSEEKSALFIPYIDYIIPLTAFTTIYLVADIFYAALYKSAMGIFMRELLMRVFILIALGIYILKIGDFTATVVAYTLALSLPGLIISLLLIKDGEFHIKTDYSHLTPELKRSMFSVAGFGILMTFSNIVVQYIDRIMIDRMLGIGEVGIYGRVFIYGTLVSIASRAVNKISGIVVAQAWKENKTEEITRIYRNSTLHQWLFGLLIFSGILANLSNIERILPEVYGSGIYVVVFIGIANLFHMVSGVSVAIMSTSRHYRLLALFIVIFVAIIIISNLLLIPVLGITGAALASAISVFIYSFMRYLFLRVRYRMEPYSWRHLAIAVIAGVAYLASMLVPDLYREVDGRMGRALFLGLDAGVRSTLLLLIFITITLVTRVSPDLNSRISTLWNRWSQNRGGKKN